MKSRVALALGLSGIPLQEKARDQPELRHIYICLMKILTEVICPLEPRGKIDPSFVYVVERSGVNPSDILPEDMHKYYNLSVRLY